MPGEMKRTKVIIGKSSLEMLADLNESAEKVDCAVVIGVAPAGTELPMGKTVEPTPFYLILTDGLFDPEDDIDETYVGFNKEEVLEKLISIGGNKE